MGSEIRKTRTAIVVSNDSCNTLWVSGCRPPGDQNTSSLHPG
ncbi:MAG: type II toxin-antitoxin system PemK/MazF family toxin, partial [Vicinamibacteria bacterium]